MKTLLFIFLPLKQHEQLRLSSALRCILVTMLSSANNRPPDDLLILIDSMALSTVLAFSFYHYYFDRYKVVFIMLRMIQKFKRLK